MARWSGGLMVAAVGKLRSGYWRQAQEAYARRLPHYVAFELVEVKDVAGRGMTDDVAMAREAQQLLKATTGARRRIVLSERGEQQSSRQLAAFLRHRLETFGQLAFVVGGPLGLPEEPFGPECDYLALSRLTLPHELARVLLLEQLYRAFTILGGEPYHK